MHLTSEIFAIGTKNDTQLKSDLNATDFLIKEFKEKGRTTPFIADSRKRFEMNQILITAIDSCVKKTNPEIVLPKRDQTQIDEESSPEEVRLLPKKDTGCTLI